MSKDPCGDEKYHQKYYRATTSLSILSRFAHRFDSRWQGLTNFSPI
ncbi:MAG: hypothetical protein ACK456_18035 [Pseudanabaenaceae cyanobacterium]